MAKILKVKIFEGEMTSEYSGNYEKQNMEKFLAGIKKEDLVSVTIGEKTIPSYPKQIVTIVYQEEEVKSNGD